MKQQAPASAARLEDPMTHATPAPDAPAPSARSTAARLLVMQRILMGLVLLVLGAGGIFGFLAEGATKVGDGALVAGLFAKAGFCFPLLKGAEVLLEQYLALSSPRARGRSPNAIPRPERARKIRVDFGGVPMAKTDYQSHDDYIRQFPAPLQDVLTQVRGAIAAAVPGAEEVISYQTPAFKFHGWLFYYSVHKFHFSLACPPPCAAFEQFAAALSPFERTKSAVKFPLGQPVPVELIRDLAKAQAKANVAAAEQNPGKTPRAKAPSKTKTIATPAKKAASRKPRGR
jgi:uncharacterized protein YdhG (YjbR/CyaY superfamily)